MRLTVIFRKARRLLVSVLAFQLVTGLCEFLPNLGIFNRVRGFLLSPFFHSCGKRFQLAKGVLINMPDRLSIGDDVYIAHGVWINATGTIRIADGAIISPKVVIASTRHRYRDGRVRLYESDSSPIHIGSGSWIASNCTVTMGITIGDGCIVGACSAVTKDLPAFHFCAGVPALVIKKIGK